MISRSAREKTLQGNISTIQGVVVILIAEGGSAERIESTSCGVLSAVAWSEREPVTSGSQRSRPGSTGSIVRWHHMVLLASYITKYGPNCAVERLDVSSISEAHETSTRTQTPQESADGIYGHPRSTVTGMIRRGYYTATINPHCNV